MRINVRSQRVQLAMVALMCAASAPLHAQRAAGWTPFDDWARVVLARMHALGSVPFDPVLAQHTLAVIHALSDSAQHADPWMARLMRERANGGRLHIEIGPAIDVSEGVLRTGRFTLDRTWIDPAPQPDHAEPGALLYAHARLDRTLSITAHASGHGDTWDAAHATIDVGTKPVQFWAGRRAAGYSTGETGSLVLTRMPRLTGGGITVHERRVPLVGPAGGELYFGRVRSNGQVLEPWLFGMRIHATPHARFDIGATRVAQFGTPNTHSLGVRQILDVLVGANLAPPYADDQVASADARWRPPLPTAIELYGEWAMHDIDAGVLIDVPAFTLGVRAPALPRARLFGLSVEHTQISHSCCGNPPWYHHFELANGWTAAGVPLGHPLGGHGREWRVAVQALPPVTLLQAAVALRTRGAENLYAPTRAGDATVFTLRMDSGVLRDGAIYLNVEAEKGDTWTEVRARSGATWRF